MLLLSSVAFTACQNHSDKVDPAKPTQTQTQTLKVLTPDWSIAATLTAMGYPPIATGDVAEYPEWAGKPDLPNTTIDLGARFAPNPELISQLSPDLVIDNDFYQHLRPLYGNTPVKSINPQTTDPNKPATWQSYADSVMALGEAIDQPTAAKTYIDKSHEQITNLGQTFRKQYPTIRKLAVIQFASANQFRSYSDNSLFKPTLDIIGLELVHLGQGNQWGFSDAKLGDLVKFDDSTCVVVVEPYSPMLQQQLENNALWQRMGYSKETANPRCMMVVPPTWIYGGMPSMVGFAESLTHVAPNHASVKTGGKR
ncbi:ABC transporter substrate-binding protein (plasmid) [Moraxella atlantae]|uniref:ABC transporter substrate-binding protein n=1 Tax=Faucicola atlantae TaxID=34059 RepID=UPI0037538B65